MIILSHRGYWKREEEKNTPIAFRRSFEAGFGTELDVRDHCGNLVVSHDIPDNSAIDFKAFLELYCKFDKHLPLAINIKADGLQNLLSALLNTYQIENYFVFDMSVPDALGYLNLGMNVFTRESIFEKEPSFYDKADGVWMDEFKTPFITPQKIKRHLNNGKKVCIVSPELHQIEHLSRWMVYKTVPENPDKKKLMLCTDFPEEAREYLND